MQRLAQVPHQAEARNRCSGLGLGKPDRGEKPTLQPKGLVHTQREQPLAQAERVQVHENPAEKQRPQAGKPPSEDFLGNLAQLAQCKGASMQYIP
jgi:hypothetical protein